MKKTILAMAVPALMAAGAANAGVSLYDQDGVSVDASGAMEVQYRKSTDKDSKAQLRLDDGDLAIKTGVEISDDLKAIGSMEFAFEKSAVSNDRLYVGLEGGFGTVTFGRQTVIFDDAGVGKDIEFGGTHLFTDDNDKDLAADQVVKYTFDTDMLYGGVSAWMEEDGKKATDQAEWVDGKVGVRFEGLDARAFYGKGKEDNKATVATTLDDVSAMALEAEYSIEGIGLAAAYGKVDWEPAGQTKTEQKSFQVAADYSLGDTTFALGFTSYEQETGSNKDMEQDTVYANVTQQLHSNVKVYAELGKTDTKKNGADQDDEVGYAAGLEVKF